MANFKMSNLYLIHSAKGSVWKKHKYLKKENGKYVYKEETYGDKFKNWVKKKTRKPPDIEVGEKTLIKAEVAGDKLKKIQKKEIGSVFKTQEAVSDKAVGPGLAKKKPKMDGTDIPTRVSKVVNKNKKPISGISAEKKSSNYNNRVKKR